MHNNINNFITLIHANNHAKSLKAYFDIKGKKN